jgi:hypothetical protein
MKQDNCSDYWAQLVKDTPDHTDKKKTNKGEVTT